MDQHDVIPPHVKVELRLDGENITNHPSIIPSLEIAQLKNLTFHVVHSAHDPAFYYECVMKFNGMVTVNYHYKAIENSWDKTVTVRNFVRRVDLYDGLHPGANRYSAFEFDIGQTLLDFLVNRNEDDPENVPDHAYFETLDRYSLQSRYVDLLDLLFGQMVCQTPDASQDVKEAKKSYEHAVSLASQLIANVKKQRVKTVVTAAYDEQGSKPVVATTYLDSVVEAENVDFIPTPLLRHFTAYYHPHGVHLHVSEYRAVQKPAELEVIAIPDDTPVDILFFQLYNSWKKTSNDKEAFHRAYDATLHHISNM